MIKLDKAVESKKVIIGWENCRGTILYLKSGYYQFSKVFESANLIQNDQSIEKKLQEIIHPVKFWDTLFAMDTNDSTILDYWIPSNFCLNMFTINSDLRIRLNDLYPLLGNYYSFCFGTF